jgi:hypothetical protein
VNVLDDLARVTQIFFGPDFQGIFRAGRLNLSALSGATATRTLGVNDVFEAPKVANRRVLTGTAAVLSQKNSHPLTYGELAASVTVAAKRAFAAQVRESRENTAPTGTAYSTNWQGFHKTAVRVEVGGAFSATGADITGAADKILGDLKPHIQTIELQTDLRAYEWRLGDVVAFTYPRGFDAGKNCYVVGIDVDLLGERVNLTLLTQTAPDVTTSSYP